jgi:drug/metabolite transporter (DMT)-like permease
VSGVAAPAAGARATPAAGGTLLTLAAMACFATLDTTTKYISAAVPLLLALWFRYFFQAVATTAAVLPLRGWSVLRTANPKAQLLRGLLLLTSSLMAFLGLRYMQVGEFTAIVMVTPLIITLVASTALGETVSPLRWALVAGGFTGALMIVRPGHEAFRWVSLLPLALVVSHSWFQILTSKMAKTEDPVTMHLYTGWVGTLATSLVLPFVWTALPSWTSWGWLMLMGLSATVGHFMLILAYQRAPAGTLAPYLYAQIAFAMVGGWLVFGHLPDRTSLAGIGLIAACGAGGVWLALRESRAAVQMAGTPADS